MFTTLGEIMLLGLGADYCIFLSSMNKDNLKKIIGSIVVCLLTTESAFGTLVFSDTKVLASFGSVLLLGLLGTVICSLVCNLYILKKVHN